LYLDNSRSKPKNNAANKRRWRNQFAKQKSNWISPGPKIKIKPPPASMWQLTRRYMQAEWESMRTYLPIGRRVTAPPPIGLSRHTHKGAIIINLNKAREHASERGTASNQIWILQECVWKLASAISCLFFPNGSAFCGT